MSDDVECREEELERREAIVRAGLERVRGPENVLAVGEGFAILQEGERAVRYSVPALLDTTIPLEVGDVVELRAPRGRWPYGDGVRLDLGRHGSLGPENDLFGDAFDD